VSRHCITTWLTEILRAFWKKRYAWNTDN
jgi:hypothetical protein